jgi:GST-like protein
VIDLYTWTTPNGRKACIALEELGLPYTRIPAIVDRDNGMSLMESGANPHLSRRQDRVVPLVHRRSE